MDAVDTRLVASYAVAIAFDVLMPVGLVLWARRRLGVAWKVVGWGAAAFALSQLLTRVPLVQVAQYFMRDALKTSSVLLGVWIAVLSLTAGLFEETARLWAFRKPLKDFRRWRDAVGFGVGHGGLESALLVGGLAALGLVNVIALSSLDPSTLPLKPEQVAQVVEAKATIAALDWWMPLLGAYERLGAMVVHIALSVVVLQRFIRDAVKWYWLAVGAHACFNALTVVVGKQATAAWGQQAGAFAAEGMVTLAALASLWVILYFRRVEAARDTAAVPAPT
ncbi:YhfC family intramembrane metalloprotease [Myxococcus vastator]|uniref:YhfC family intramembrane metalloprotease n=1 Tax=Myxococcus vastator TaxID=2709664 RepID=UPI0013D3B41C|nr:YhfC family glutamic-type intramembrane protease [Myxococcus vastator]